MADVFGMLVGMPLQFPNGVGTPSNVSLNATTVSLAYFFESKTSDPITWLGVRRSSITGTPGTYRISLQGVDSNGNPDGVIKASGNAYATFTGGSLTNGAVNRITLNTSYTPALNEILCYVIEYSSGTVDASNLLSVTATAGSAAALVSKYPCWASGASGVYTKQTAVPLLAYGTATTAFGWPVNVVLNQSINSGATAEAGAKFSWFNGLTGTYTVKGMRLTMGTTVAAKSVVMSLYSGGLVTDVTPLISATYDTDWVQASGTGRAEFLFNTYPLPALTMGNTYRIALSTPDASNQQLVGFSVSNSGDMSAVDYGDNFTLSSRTGGNWTDTPNSRLLLELILGDVTPSAGGSGSGPMVFGF